MSTLSEVSSTQGGQVAALFVRRPVLAIVLNLLIVVAGVAAYTGVEVRELPNIDQPVITIRTTYTGATPDTVDKEITGIIEGAVARTPGVQSIASQSSAGQSRVTITFDDSTDLNAAANDLRDAIGGLRTLPDDADPPQIVKADTSSDAIMRLAATSSTLPIEQLTQLVKDRVIDRLAAVAGVADVQTYGDRDPLVRIIIDPDALASRHLTVGDLVASLGNVALDAPAGNVSDANQTLLVRADASAKSAEEIGAIAINKTTRVSDVADVVFGPADRSTTLRMNGKTGIGLGIVRQAKSNTLDISTGVRAAVAELNAALAKEGLNLIITSDDATFIRNSIEEVLFTLGLSIAIVIGIIYIFLRSIRVTFIPAITVPIALIGAFAAIYLAGFSLNILTLLALVLATGMVVDDAIVVIENITRQRGLGLGPRAAAVLGTKQVFFAVLSTTATLAAVFIPISFFPGVAGRLFSEFGFVLAFAVMLSAFVALTLCPMLASRWISAEEHEPSHNPIGRAVAGFGHAAERLYSRLLTAALNAPVVVIVAAILFAGGAVLAFRLLPSELTPQEDRGFIPISVRSPQGATVDYTADQMRIVERAIQPFVKSGEVVNTFATAQGGGGGGFMFVTLAPWDQRTRTQQQITSDINARLQSIPGVQVFAFTSNSLGIRGGGQGLQFAITGTDYDTLSDAADNLMAAMQDDPVFTTVRLNYDTTQPQLSIKIDRARAADMGVSLDAITTVLQTLLSGRDLGTYYIGEDAIDIKAQAPDGMIQDPSGLDRIQLRTAGGKMVPLSSLVSYQETAVAPSLQRQDQRRAVPMSANLADGVDFRTGMNHLEAIAAKSLPPGMSIVYTGEAKELNTASSGVAQTFAFALLVVVLVLAAQFESFMSAFILMATVPFGLAAAVYAMLLTGGSLNIYSQIGLVMLVGLMAKNGILIVEFANQLRDRGASVREAIHDAALIRLRPVVMTMIATVLGGLPLLLTAGAGAESRSALGWIIVGGLGFATIATLFLTPVVFDLLARFSKPRVAEEQRLRRELAEAGDVRGFRPTAEEEGGLRELPVAAE
ncbi:MAG TPA: efflux RND transporter permease subunit [Bauldia sp.]|nr:efflux RND transporter permease subunit [Bauldia sp.]